MSRNYVKCPFSKIGCKECPIYRGRHCYIKVTEDEALKITAMKNSKTEWIAGFNGFFDELNDSFRKGIKSYNDWEEPSESEK
jgi:hypothetical protein